MPPRLLRDAPSEPTSLANLLGQRGQAEARTVLAQRQPWTQAITQAGQGAAQSVADAMERKRLAPLQAFETAKEVEDFRATQQERQIKAQDEQRAQRQRAATEAGDLLHTMRDLDADTQKSLYGRFSSKLDATGLSGLEPPEGTEFGTPEFYRYATWMRNNLNSAYAPAENDREAMVKQEWEKELGRDLNMDEMTELKYKVDPETPQRVTGVLNGQPAWAMYDQRSGQFFLPDGQNVTGRFTPPQGRPAAAGENLDADIAAICDGIAAGRQPPGRKNARWSGTNLVKLEGCLNRKTDEEGRPFSMHRAELRWQAQQRGVQTLNGTQQTRLRQIGNSIVGTIDKVESLIDGYEDLKINSGLPILNKATVSLALAGLLGAEARDIVTQMEAYVTDIHTELSTVYRSGNAPTDSSLEKAEQNIQTWWSIPTMRKGLNMIRTQMNIRLNAIDETPATTGGAWSQGDDGTYAPDYGNAAWQDKAIQHEVPAEVRSQLGGYNVEGDQTYQFEDGSYWHKNDRGDIKQVFPKNLTTGTAGEGIGNYNGRQYATAGFSLPADMRAELERAQAQAAQQGGQ